MKTPVSDFVKNYAKKNCSRLHMPGHKGNGFSGVEQYDITEIDGADVLYSPTGIIKESEDNATSLFDTAHTFFSTEGSSLCIRAMIFLVCQGKECPLILAARNVHKTFISAAALCGADISWLYPEEGSHLCSCKISANSVKTAIESAPKKPCAVYITSPDYLGNEADIKGISIVCREYDIPLVVDNAHGAYLHFLKSSRHPIHLGASMCCDSAHKTLPVLTGGAYLHISKKANDKFCRHARTALSLFASTSPSYLILQSLDLCNRYLFESFKSELVEVKEKTESLKELIRSRGFFTEGTEELKITVNAAKSGYSGTELCNLMRLQGIECEFCDSQFAVMMFTPQNKAEDFEKTALFFSSLLPKAPLAAPKAKWTAHPIQAMSVRKAVFSNSETVDVNLAAGRICATPTVSCPPAVPVAVSGELITEETVELFKQYGINKIEVIK